MKESDATIRKASICRILSGIFGDVSLSDESSPLLMLFPCKSFLLKIAFSGLQLLFRREYIFFFSEKCKQ